MSGHPEATSQTPPTRPPLKWSSSYLASASSSAGPDDSDETTVEEEIDSDAVVDNSLALNLLPAAQTAFSDLLNRRRRSSTLTTQQRPHAEFLPQGNPPTSGPRSISRSRSPAMSNIQLPDGINGSSSMLLRKGGRSGPQTHVQRKLLPDTLGFLQFTLDVRKAGETLLLLVVITLSMYRLSLTSDNWIVIGEHVFLVIMAYGFSERNPVLFAELAALTVASLVYVFISQHPYWNRAPASPPPPTSPVASRDKKASSSVNLVPPPIPSRMSLIWMTSEKNYRWVNCLPQPDLPYTQYSESLDDGILTALLLAPTITAAMLYASGSYESVTENLLPPSWLIEKSATLPKPQLTTADALRLSRRNLVQLTILCSCILLVHVCASLYLTTRHTAEQWIPKNEMRRTGRYVLFTFQVALGAVAIRALLAYTNIGIWQGACSRVAQKLKITATY